MRGRKLKSGKMDSNWHLSGRLLCNLMKGTGASTFLVLDARTKNSVIDVLSRLAVIYETIL